MNCSKCGAELLEGAKFCAICGTAVSEIVAPSVEPSVQESETIPTSMPSSADEPVSIFEAVSSEPVVSSENVAEPVYAGVVSSEAVTTDSSASAPVAEAPKKSKKPLVIVAVAAAIVLVIGIIALVAFLAMSGFFSGKPGPQKPYLLIQNKDEAMVYYGAKDPAVIDGDIYTHQYSSDGKVIAMTIEADDVGAGELVLCTGKDVISVAEDVYTFKLSANGQKIAYLSDYDDDDFTATLSIYDVASKKANEIADGVFMEVGVIMSPDAKSVAYVADVDFDEYGSPKSFMGFLSKNGEKPVELGENQMAIAIADGLSYIYYFEMNPEDTSEADLYVKKGETVEKLGEADMENPVYLNKDCSEMIFTRSGSTYISVAGADKEKVSGDALETLILPRYTSIDYSFGMSYVIITGASSLKDQAAVFSSDGDISVSYIDSKLEVEEIDSLEGSSYDHSVSVSADGKSLFFIDDSGKGQLYKNFRNLQEKPVEVDPGKDIISVVVSDDFSTMYIVDEDYTLFVQRGTDEPVEIANDVDPSYITFSIDGSRVYYMADIETDDDSYYSKGVFYVIDNKNGAKPEEIADDVYTYEVSDYGVVYYVFDQEDEDTYDAFFDAFYSADGKKFTSVMDEAVLY